MASRHTAAYGNVSARQEANYDLDWAMFDSCTRIDWHLEPASLDDAHVLESAAPVRGRCGSSNWNCGCCVVGAAARVRAKDEAAGAKERGTSRAKSASARTPCMSYCLRGRAHCPVSFFFRPPPPQRGGALGEQGDVSSGREGGTIENAYRISYIHLRARRVS